MKKLKWIFGLEKNPCYLYCFHFSDELLDDLLKQLERPSSIFYAICSFIHQNLKNLD